MSSYWSFNTIKNSCYESWNNIRPALNACLTLGAIEGSRALFAVEQEACNQLTEYNSQNEESNSALYTYGVYTGVALGAISLVGVCIQGYKKLPEGWIKEIIKNNSISVISSATLGYLVNGIPGAIEGLVLVALFNRGQNRGEAKTANPKLNIKIDALEKALVEEKNASIRQKKELEFQKKEFEKDDESDKSLSVRYFQVCKKLKVALAALKAHNIQP